jgi:hypothetical protein
MPQPPPPPEREGTYEELMPELSVVEHENNESFFFTFLDPQYWHSVSSFDAVIDCNSEKDFLQSLHSYS